MKRELDLNRQEDLLFFLRSDNRNVVRKLLATADEVRRRWVGDEVHLRGTVEISNQCRRNCLYCGIRQEQEISRYTMTRDEILGCAESLAAAGYETIVLQGGEGCLPSDEIAAIVKAIKDRRNIAVSLSFGEHPHDVLQQWREAGADRYLLPIETGQHGLFPRIHPGCTYNVRIKLLQDLKGMGFETGTGIMVGLPGQTFESIADDLLLMKALDIDMMGAVPYIPHPDTPLGREFSAGTSCYVPATPDMALKVAAAARIIMPDINIPAAILASPGQENSFTAGLQAGANMVITDMTPECYRNFTAADRERKAETPQETPEEMKQKILTSLRASGRRPGEDRECRRQAKGDKDT